MKFYLEAIRRAIDDASSGKVVEALVVLEEALATAMSERDIHAISTLTQYAAILCMGRLGDLHRARNYCEKSLEVFPEDPHVLFHLAYIYDCLEDYEHAEHYYHLCRELSLKFQDTGLLEVLDARDKQLGK